MVVLPCTEEEAKAKFKAFCETNKIPYREPKWYLTGLYAL